MALPFQPENNLLDNVLAAAFMANAQQQQQRKGIWNPFDRASEPGPWFDPLGIGRWGAEQLQANRQAEEAKVQKQATTEANADKARKGTYKPAAPKPNMATPALAFSPQTGDAGKAFAPQPKAAPRPVAGWATSFRDPLYDQVEAQAAKELGLDPSFARLAAAVRLAGERSNHGQISSKGANTPYQFIPSTRDAFISKYQIDPWKDPLSGAKATLLHLKESMERNNGNLAAAFGEYIGGPDRSEWGEKTRAYINRTMQFMGEPGNADSAGALPNFQSAFDPSFWSNQLGALGQAEQAALTPWSMETELPPAPELPDLPTAPKRDFTASDAALARLKPVELAQVQKQRIHRANLLQGIAQGLARIPDGAGLGMVLAQVGAGALAGRAAGDAELQARQDAFDEQMAKYNLALFNNEQDKSQAAFQSAVSEYNATYQHNMKKFDVAFSQWSKNNSVSVEGNYVIVRKQEGNKVITNAVPFEPAIRSAFALQRAGVFGAQANAQMQASAATTGMTNQIIAGHALSAFNTANSTMGLGNAEEALVNSAGFMASELVGRGLLPQIVGKDVYEEMAQTTAEELLAAGYTQGNKEFTEQAQITMASKLTQLLMTNPNVRKAAASFQPIVIDGYRADRLRDSTRTTKTKVGNTTVTEKE